MYKYEKAVSRMRKDYYGKNYWCFESRKLHRRVAVFSNLEYENILNLEMNPEVEWYCEYPLETVVFIGGKETKVLFSTWVLYTNGKEEYQGVSYQKDASAKSKQQIGAMLMWCLQNNQQFSFCNETTIEKGQFFIRNLNVLFVRARRFAAHSKNADMAIINYLQNIDTATIGYLESSGRFEKNKTLDYIADLFYRGVITLLNIENECISNTMEVKYIG